MKNKLLILAVVSLFGFLQANASVPVSQVTSETYLLNQGYSSATVDMVNAGKAAANGEEYVSAAAKKEASYIAPVRWIRRLFIYLDPAMDNPDFNRHDIKMSPSVNDF